MKSYFTRSQNTITVSNKQKIEQLTSQVTRLCLDAIESKVKAERLQSKIDELCAELRQVQIQVQEVLQQDQALHPPVATVAVVPVHENSLAATESIEESTNQQQSGNSNQQPSESSNSSGSHRWSTSNADSSRRSNRANDASRASGAKQGAWRDRDGRKIKKGDQVAFLTHTACGSEYGVISKFNNKWVYARDRSGNKVYKKGWNYRVIRN